MTVQCIPLRLPSSLAALALVLALLPGSISSQAAAAAPACIDLNTASVEELTEIIHVGQGTAEVIVGTRPFVSLDGLTAISGIGPGRLEAIKGQGLACVGAAEPPPEEPPAQEEPTPSDPPESGSSDPQDPPEDDPAEEAPEEEAPRDGDDAEADGDAGPCIDLNTASAEDLERIIHIGEVRAQAIIDARPWASVDDLVELSGISDARLADIRAQGRVCPAGDEQPEGDEDDRSDDEPQQERVAPLSLEVVGCAAPDLLTVVVSNPNPDQVPFTVRVDDTLVAPERDAAHGSTTVTIEGWSGVGRVSLVWTGDVRNYGASTDVVCEPTLDLEPDPEPGPNPTVPPQPRPEPDVAPEPEPTPGPEASPTPETADDETDVADEVVEAPTDPGSDGGVEGEADESVAGDIDDETAVADEVVEVPEDGEAGEQAAVASDRRRRIAVDGAPGPAESAAGTTQVASAETSGAEAIVTPTRVDAGGGGLATSGAPAAPLWLVAALATLALAGLGAELRAARGRRRQRVGAED